MKPLTPHMATALLVFSSERRYVHHKAMDAVHGLTLRALRKRGYIECCGVFVSPYRVPVDRHRPFRQAGYWITDAGLEARDNYLRSIG